ncbi:MAG: LuxR C-terminal-related transcriptional regulator [Thermomicrobiales bacterium]
MAAICDPELLPTVVAEALGLKESGSTSLLATMAAYLKSQPALLLFDNCEHIVDACAVLVDTLLSSCPDLCVITTSREPLHIDGERQYRVPPLDVPDPRDLGDVDAIGASAAVQLFLARARSVQPSFDLTSSNADSIARICVRLEGIPLALELAAARTHVLGIDQILARLDDTFHLLTGTSRVAPTRHQTLRAALEWSDDLLTERERTVFRRLAVFAGDFRLDGVEEVCSDTTIDRASVLDIVSGLADKSLVVAESGEQAAWYRLLEPVRQYALELLDQRGEAKAIRARHAAFYLDLVERAETRLRGPDQMRWLDRLERERPNLRAALGWARQTEPDLELRLAVALAPLWEIYGQLREGVRQLRDALERTERIAESRLHMRALGQLGRLALYIDRSTVELDTEADSFIRESLRIARKLGDDRAIASALIDLGRFYRLQSDDARAISYLEAAMTSFRALDDEPEALRVQLHLGLAIYHLNETADSRAQAERMFQDSLERLRAIGDLRFAGLAQVLLGQTAQGRGDLGQAIRRIAEGISTHLHLNEQGLIVLDLVVLSEVLLDAGQTRQAVHFAGANQALLDRLGSSVDRTPFANIAAVRKQLDRLRRESWFDAAWAEGYAWNPDDVAQAACALSETLDDAGQSASPDLTAPASLTAREIEVARFLADGYTDREIADALFISPSTVSTHVHHILQKLDLRSRVQVADRLIRDETIDPE